MNNHFVIIDAGHGELTPGKRSPDGKLLEWANNRRVALAVRRALYNAHIKRVDIIGGSPVDVPLKNRVQYINIKADEARARGLEPLCLSLHSNASQNGAWGSANGVGVLAHPGNKEAVKLASRLSSAIAVGVANPTSDTPTLKTVVGLADRGVRPSRWPYIIRKTRCTALIMEIGFHDNRGDVAIMLRPEFPRQVADAIVGVLQ